MQIPALFVILFVFFASTFAAPIGNVERRATAPVFKQQTYNQLSISGGNAGNAQAQALARFSALDLNDAKNVAESDIEFLNSVNQIANEAEDEAFNPAIAKATGSAKTALQNGKIQNKVLKLTASVLKLKVQAAQGQNVASTLTEEQTKLSNNIKLDEDAAGQAATKLSFNAST